VIELHELVHDYKHNLTAYVGNLHMTIEIVKIYLYIIFEEFELQLLIDKTIEEIQ
jgi:hypothetical protein